MIRFFSGHINGSRASLLLVVFSLVIFFNAEGRIIYSKSPGGNWTNTNSWNGGSVPIAGDTVVIQAGHTISVSANLYSNSTYMFLIAVGTLDLTNNGKLSFSASSKLIIETGGKILGDGNSDTISIGTGTSEYRGGVQGDITGPAYINDGHPPSTGEGTAGCGCYTPGTIPLPITLLNFYANVQDDQVSLVWATSMEENFEKFVVERSSTGLNFLPIGEVDGVGRNLYDIETKYSFQDESPLIGFNYYRLKAVDLDGAFEYFDVRVVRISGQKDLVVYPNPSLGESIFFRLNFNPGEGDQIALFNDLGVELSRSSVKAIENQINVGSGLTPGVYLLKYFSSDFKVTQRVIVTQ